MRFRKHKFLAAIFLCSFFFTALVYADPVDEYVQAMMAENHIPGAAVAIVKNGNIIKSKAYGLASVEFNAPVTTDTVFEIGSVSKQITAAAIMLLVEDGKIDLDEKISAYLNDTPEAWENVTVRNLLTHTSGVKSYTTTGGFELSKRYTVEDFIDELSKYPLDFEPGSAYRYSNSGYSLLGYIIESVSGETYWEFLRERIFSPLKMDHTADRDPQFIIPNRATGYEWEKNRLVGRDYELTDLFSAGAIVSTIDDMAKWVIALRGQSLLQTSSKEESWKPFNLNDGKESLYGLGWNIVDLRGQHVLRHGGQTAGFAANVSRYVDSDLSIVVLANLGTQGLGSDIALGIAKIYIPSLSLKSLKPSASSEPTATRAITVFLNDVLRNKANASVLTDDLIIKLSTERAMAENDRILSFGKITKIELIDLKFSDVTKVYQYRVETEKKLMLWSFSLDPTGKISNISLLEEE